MFFFLQNIAQKKSFSPFFLHIIFGIQLSLTGFHVNKLCESVYHLAL